MSNNNEKEIIQYRIKKFIEYKEEQELQKECKNIYIKLPDGSVVNAISNKTTPFEIAGNISQGLANSVIVAKINDELLWDLSRPLEYSCDLKLLKWEDEEAKYVYWHSSSHVLGEALEKVFNVLLANGPPIDSGGFYYDSYAGEMAFSEKECEKVEKECKKIIKEKQRFERIELSKSQALELFKYNKFKCQNINDKVKEDGKVVIYRCGDLVDPCTGPHIIHTGKVKAFKVTKNSSAYWRGNENNESLQRIYGISFPSKKLLKEYLDRLEELKSRSHKHIGQQQKLWFMHRYAPGMVFFSDKGTKIYNKLQNFMKSEQRKRGFIEVHTPNMFHSDLYKKSGHWENFKEDMFITNVDGCDHALKPMNCPAHCVVYKFEKKTFKELPVRFAEYGVCHRNEKRGTLTGMTRVRRFIQDDAHIFVRSDQIAEEMERCLKFMDFVYQIFGFKYQLFLSTRPEKKYLGKVEDWNIAESKLKAALEKFGKPFDIDVGGGAFYGPKIDIKTEDSLNRFHQCATIQLDFNLPSRFDLSFINSKGENETPFMIHRAIFGSIERFLSVLCEHCAGKWPFWISPRQIMIIPFSKDHHDYCYKLKDLFYKSGFDVDIDVSNKRLKKRIRNAQLNRYNYMLVVGNDELESGSVTVRVRDHDIKENERKKWERPVKDVLAFFKDITEKKHFHDPVDIPIMVKKDEDENSEDESQHICHHHEEENDDSFCPIL